MLRSKRWLGRTECRPERLHASLGDGDVDGGSNEALSNAEAGSDITETVRRYSHCRFVFTSRNPLPGAIQAALGETARISSVDLDRKTERSLLVTYLHKRQAEVYRLPTELDRVHGQVPHTPLLLRLASSIFDDGRQIPQERTSIFKSYAERLLRPEAVGGRELDGLEYALRQLVRSKYVQSGGDRGFTMDRAITILTADKDMLAGYNISLPPHARQALMPSWFASAVESTHPFFPRRV
jgi:hypothetical protein